MLIRFSPQFMYETPGGAAGAGTAQAEPGAPGSQQGQGTQPNGFRETFFANVPDEQWAVIEPHISRVNQHVSQLEQSNAALKGYTPQQVQGLVNFAQGLTNNPIGMWEKLTRDLQSRGVIDQNIDLDHLMLLAQGQDPDSGGQQPPPGTPGQQELGDVPPWAQSLLGAFQEISQTVQELQQARETDQRTTVERRQDAALKFVMKSMRDKMVEAGVPNELIKDDRLRAALLVSRGNMEAALQSELNYRNETLKGFTESKTNPQRQQQKLDMEPGEPTRQSQARKQSGDDGFEAARGPAEQFLAARLAEQSQGG